MSSHTDPSTLRAYGRCAHMGMLRVEGLLHCVATQWDEAEEALAMLCGHRQWDAREDNEENAKLTMQDGASCAAN